MVNVKMNIEMGNGKLAQNSFPRTHEDIKLELQRFGQTCCSPKCKKKAQEFKPDIMFTMETRLVKEKGKKCMGET